jgi:hypothetical protein
MLSDRILCKLEEPKEWLFRLAFDYSLKLPPKFEEAQVQNHLVYGTNVIFSEHL